MTWLLTGGAGYIGAHIVAALRAEQLDVVVLDDLSTGRRVRVPPDVPFVEASVLDRERVLAALREHNVRGVIHLAARKSVPESIADPALYYRENVVGFERLLSAMTAAGTSRIVYSSSAAVIGTPLESAVDEQTPTRPENPYGRTKLICEWMLQDAARAGGPRSIALRYFNVAGAGTTALGDLGGDNLVPRVFDAIGRGTPPQIFGDDYDTRDGSCVRDFVHVADLARAHVAAVRRLGDVPGGAGRMEVYNVGRGEGVTVREVIAAIAEMSGRQLDPVVVARRPGDPAHVVGAVNKIERELGWRAELDLHDMVASAWAARAVPAP